MLSVFYTFLILYIGIGLNLKIFILVFIILFNSLLLLTLLLNNQKNLKFYKFDKKLDLKFIIDEKVIIYTTDDKVISLQLVNKIISNPNYKNYKFDILLTKPNFLRKIKILIVILLFGSIKDFLKRINNKISIFEIVEKNKQCKVVTKITEKYDFGLSVYCSSKIQVENFKIYNFHLGSLINQRGSLFFFTSL